jgi:hypothetical protein
MKEIVDFTAINGSKSASLYSESYCLQSPLHTV